MSNGSAQVGGLKVLKALVWIVYAIAVAASIIIAFAFFLLLFDASPQAGFVEFIYTAGSRFADPFVGMIEPTKLSNGGIVSWSALFAIVAYLVLAWIIGSILDAISRSIYNKSRPTQVVAAQQPVVQQPVVVAQPAPTPAPAPAAEPPAPAEAPDAAEAPAAETPPPADPGQ